MEKLFGKNILFISPRFFNYEILIMHALEKEGAIVTFFNERPSDKGVNKVMFRIFKKMARGNIETYYQDILNRIDNEMFDYIFIIKPENMPVTFIHKLKLISPNVKTILYMFDSIKNYKSILEKINEFDVKYSFDRDDCSNYEMSFRPLFYAQEFEDIRCQAVDYQYDYSFVGTLHSDRMIILQKIEKEFAVLKQSSKYYYLYIPMKMMYFARKIYRHEYKKLSMSEIHFEPLSFPSLLDIIRKSKIVIDIQHPKQSGLTMRTIEILGAGRKLITTNRDVKNYDFYNSSNILIVDREKPVITKSFVDSTYVNIDNDVLNRYTIAGFIKEIFKEV